MKHSARDRRHPGSGPDGMQLAELRAIVEDDVRHLQLTWSPEMDFGALRRDAATLRRLLVDDGGDLAKLWRWEGRPGQLMIDNVADLARFPHFRGLGFGVAYPAEVPGLQMSEMLLWRVEEAESPEIQAALRDDGEYPDLPIRKFVDSVCVVVNDQPVRRGDLVTYITNRRGGAHYDPHGKTGNPRRRAAYAVLDGLNGWEVNYRDAAFAQLVTIGRDVVNSRNVVELISS